jgi:plastocyanin
MTLKAWFSTAILTGMLTPLAFAQVSGTVKLDGKAPEMKKIDMSAVPDCAKMHDQPIYEEMVVVGKDGGLANAVVSIKLAEGQNLPGGPSKTPVVLDQKGCQYVPHVIAAQVGQPIVVKNSDALLHNVHTQPEKNKPANMAQPFVSPGMKLPATTDAEYIHTKCDVHPWMSAWIAVIDNPYFAVTDKDGKYELPKGLPDGKYTLHLWQEKFGEQDQNIEVKGGKATADFTVKQDAAGMNTNSKGVMLAKACCEVPVSKASLLAAK